MTVYNKCNYPKHLKRGYIVTAAPDMPHLMEIFWCADLQEMPKDGGNSISFVCTTYREAIEQAQSVMYTIQNDIQKQLTHISTLKKGKVKPIRAALL